MSKNASFTFLNTSKPGDTLTPANRKLIRSNATSQRLCNRRRKGTSSTKDNDAGVVVPLRDPPITRQLSPLNGNIQQHMYSMLEYQETVVGPSLFPLKILYDLNPAQHFMISIALQDEKVLNSAVAVASLRYAKVEKLSEQDSRSWNVMVLRYKQRAIELVRTHMAGGGVEHIDVSIVLCIMHLAALELIVLNEVGWQMHRSALRQLADGPHTRSAVNMARISIIDVDYLGSYMFDKQPLFSNEEFESRALTLGTPQHVSTSRCGNGVTTAHDSRLDTDHLDEVVLSTLERMRSLDELLSQGDDESYLRPRVQAYLASRISIEESLFRLADQHTLSNHSRVVCFAAQIYTNRVFRTFHKGAEIPHRIAARLKESVVSLLKNPFDCKGLSRHTLWAAMMGGIGTRDAEVRCFFIATISAVCNTFNWSTWQDVHDQLITMPWSDAQIGAECRSLWLNAMEPTSITT